MDWVLNHFRLIMIVGGAIAYWLNQRKKAKEEQEIKGVLSAPDPRAQMNDDGERTRRIQEEIRRKILERAGGTTRPQAQPQTASAPMRPAPPPLPVEQPKADAYNDTPTTAEALVAADQAMLERQQQLAEKLRELQQQRRDIERPAEAFAEKTAKAMSASGTSVLGSPLADLRNPTAVRRAIILREVLGTPVGLR